MPTDVESADFNNDGRRDVAVLTAAGNSARVHFHLGNTAGWPGTSSTGSLPLDNSLVTPYALGLASGDFNGDGIVDLAVTQSGTKSSADTAFCNSTNNGTVVLLGTGGARPGFAIKTCLTAANTNLNDAVIADFNNDGKQDLAVGDSGVRGLRVYLGKGDGTFEAPKFPTGLVSSVPGPMWAVDLNGDHNVDIVTRFASGAEVFLGNGTGGFVGSSAGIGSPLFYSQQGNHLSFALGYANDDAYLDMVGAIRAQTISGGPFQNYAFVSLGLGNGAFAAQAEAHLIPDGTIGSTVVSDFNKDHKLDFAVADQTGHRVYVYLGYGDGTFFDAPTYSVGSQPKLMVAGDFSGPLNGWPDNWTDLFIVDNNQGAQATTWILRQLAGAGDPTGPTVSVTSPAGGSSLQGLTTVSANAIDPDGITRLEFYADNGLIGVATSPPYSVVWDTFKWPNGPRTLTARAYDTLENVSTSAGVAITVNNGDGVPPTVSLTAPANGSLVSVTTLVKANATDNTNIASVEFYDGATLIGTDTAAPYEVPWDIATVVVGPHTLTAKASDGVNATTSSPVVVTVDHPPLANAGPDQVTEALSSAGATVTLSGSGSDPDAGDTVSYKWTTFFGAVVSTTPVVTGVPAALGLNYFILTITDNHGAATTDLMAVTVRDTQPPMVTAPAAISIAATRSEGAQGNVPTSPASTALNQFLVAATAVDLVDATLGTIPTRGIGLGGAGIDVDVDDTSIFPVGTTQVRFGFVDDSSNVGSAT
ncbi:MAG: Ig-like domain-containing protein, partial [Vicinamibacterales bacterium]